MPSDPRPRSDESHCRIESGWWGFLACLTAALIALSAVVAVVAGPWLLTEDSALFQHGGWYVTQGAVPYVDFWDLKPPLIYAVTAALALAAGGDVLLLHSLSVVAAGVAIVVSVPLVGQLAHDATGDGTAAFAAGLVVLAVPATYGLPPFGIRPKYFLLCFGVVALLLATRGRSGASGVAAAIASGFHQQGLGIALLVVAIAADRDGLRAAGRTVVGGLSVAAAVVLPFALAGALVPMLVETVIVPLTVTRRYTLSERLVDIALALGYASALIPVAAYGWLRSNVGRARIAVSADGGRTPPSWWVPVGGVLYGAAALFIDMEGSLDMILWLPFLAVGVGQVVAAVRRDRRRAAVLCVLALLVAAGPAWYLAPNPPLSGTLEEEHDRHAVADFEHLPKEPANPDVRTVYWDKRQPDRCHYRLSQKERVWIHLTDATFEDRTCGDWPSGEPPI
ncbi:DolP-mannose mannosyltransferase [Halegenticoccus tardaugens]|uniref:DolP-mannose mannosyltransferase n=1 Tax=Halegenticoccus tardaugens TaxID=2071624 RepID=UPI00100A49D8|nr:DolP-mannose mannosyltransferase [Halegenticoccus tardaugens]